MSTSWSVRGALALAVMTLAACKPSEILDVGAPSNLVASSAVQGQGGAENSFNGAQYQTSVAIAARGYLIEEAGVLTDEFTTTDINETFLTQGFHGFVDARMTGATYNSSLSEPGDNVLASLLLARLELLAAKAPLEQYEPASGQWRVGETYALVGYIETLIGEDYCAGATLSEIPFGGGVIFGHPLTTDSIFGAAEADFDSALAHAAGNDTIANLASVGLGRALMNRNRYDSAAMAVQNVPTSFVWNTVLEASSSVYQYVQNLYANVQAPTPTPCSSFTVSDREGTNGLNYVSANDPRLVLNASLEETCDGAYSQMPDSIFYYPVKFGWPSTMVPFATGVEARLIEAEAALHDGDPTTWAADLNALRAAAPSTYLALASGVTALTTDSTINASADEQVDVMFRERAFWLFGMDNRLGDMRRLVRQYNRGAETVYPTGAYAPTLQSNATFQSQTPYAPTTYGTDVNFTLPSAQSGVDDANPYYKGCTSPNGTGTA